MNNINTLAKRLRELRCKADLTQTQVAEKINVSQSTYAYYETARIEPRIDTLILLAELFQTSIDYLVGRY